MSSPSQPVALPASGATSWYAHYQFVHQCALAVVALGITSGVIPESAVPGTIARDQEVTDAISAALAGLTKSSIGLNNVNNTADANKPISSATQTALNDKATHAEVTSAIQAVVGAAPVALDTLVEIAAQLAADESVTAALTTAIGQKAPALTQRSGPAVTSATTAVANELVPVDTATPGAVVPVALPSSAPVGTQVAIRWEAGTVYAPTLTAPSGETIAGQASVAVAVPGETLTVQKMTATVWRGLSKFTPQGAADARNDARYSPKSVVTQAQQYRTLLDGSQQLTQTQPPPFATLPTPGHQPVVVNPAVRHQYVVGFGAALTDSAAYCLLNYLTPSARATLLAELYGPDQNNWGTCRFAIGGSDFRSSPTDWVWETVSNPSVTVDPAMSAFNLAPDNSRVIPVLQQIAAINPRVRFIASLWNFPPWMSTFGVNGYRPNPTYYTAFANYWVTALQALAAVGIRVWAISPVNEPYNLTMTAQQLNTFVSGYLGPALAAAGLDVKLLAGDDSWTFAGPIVTQLADPGAGPFYDGSAWHAYTGTSGQMGAAARQFPGKELHVTEMRNMLAESAAPATAIMAGDVVIGALRNAAASVTVWNLALDQAGNPSTNNVGRQGALTINNSTGVVTRNPAYYALTHLSRFLRPGAQRIGSTTYAVGKSGTQIETVAFQNADGSIVLMAYNPTGAARTFNVVDGRTGTGFPVTLAAGEVSTFTWGTPATNLPAGTPAGTFTVPAAPVLTATGQTAQVALSWSAPSSASPISGYTLRRGSTSGTETVLAVVPPTATSYTDPTGAGTFYYTLTATNTGGESTASVEVSATATALAAPSSAGILTATGGVTQVALSWTLPTGVPLDTVALYRSSSAGSQGTLVATLAGTATSYTDVGGIAGGTYYYTMVQANTAGSVTSAQTGAATSALPVPAYDAMRRFSVANKNELTWLHVPAEVLVNPAVVVTVATSGSGTITGVTYGGVAMTLVSQQTATGANARTLAMYVLAAPPSGPQPVVATLSGATASNSVGNSTSFGRVHQSAPTGTPATYAGSGSATATTSLTGGASNDLVVAAISSRQVITPAAGQTARWNNSQGNTYAALTTQAGGTGTIASTFMLAAADNAAMIAVPLKAA